MIYGAHALVYSRQPDEARVLLDKILGTTKVDAGSGSLIFALPPAEIAVHPADGAPGIDLYLMCQDIEKTILELREKGVTFSRPVREVSWGRVSAIALPGGGELGLYQPRHPSPLSRPAAAARTDGKRRGGSPTAASRGRRGASAKGRRSGRS